MIVRGQGIYRRVGSAAELVEVESGLDAVRRLIEVARRDSAGRMLGYLATTWVPVEQLAAALAGEQVATENKEVPKVAACVRSAAEVWRN